MAVVKVAGELNLLSPLDSRQLASTDVTFCTVKAAFVRLEKDRCLSTIAVLPSWYDCSLREVNRYRRDNGTLTDLMSAAKQIVPHGPSTRDVRLAMLVDVFLCQRSGVVNYMHCYSV